MSNRELITQQRAKFRADGLAARSAIEGRLEKNHSIDSKLQRISAAHSSSAIHVYVSTEEEASTHGLLRSLIESHGSVVVPNPAAALKAAKGQGVQFLIKSYAELEPGRLGILGPTRSVLDDPSRNIPVSQITLFVVPGVVFDSRGYRRGYGSGYYDRVLAQADPDAERIGVCFDCQRVPYLPELDHDEPVHSIITESEVLICL